MILILVGSIGGFYLCLQWRGLTVRGWELSHSWVQYASEMHWGSLKNPLNAYAEWCKKLGREQGKADWISTYAQRVIFFFILTYILAIALSMTIVVLTMLNIIWHVNV